MSFKSFDKEDINRRDYGGLSVLADIIGGFSPYLARKIRGGLVAKNEIIKALYQAKAKNAIDQEDLNRAIGNLKEVHNAIKANKSSSASMQRTKARGKMAEIKDKTKEFIRKGVQSQAILAAEDVANRIGSELTAGEAGQMLEPYQNLIEERIK